MNTLEPPSPQESLVENGRVVLEKLKIGKVKRWIMNRWWTTFGQICSLQLSAQISHKDNYTFFLVIYFFSCTNITYMYTIKYHNYQQHQNLVLNTSLITLDTKDVNHRVDCKYMYIWRSCSSVSCLRYIVWYASVRNKKPRCSQYTLRFIPSYWLWSVILWRWSSVGSGPCLHRSVQRLNQRKLISIPAPIFCI